MMNIFGFAFNLFGWFFWIMLLVVIVLFVFKLLERLKNNDLNTYYHISPKDAAKIIRGKEERISIDQTINNIQG
jgi:uncharacterized membrane protein